MTDVVHAVEDGIERIVYKPAERRFETPLLLQHGMWHGARCWQLWQELFAQWGWESHAYSLPGHGKSPVQRPIRFCTLGYYLRFLAAEAARLPRPPVLIGHSMGGALTQWYLKYVGDLPAAVLVAPWTSHTMLPSILKSFAIDLAGAMLSLLTLTTTPMVRDPLCAARLFLTPGAVVSPQELHAQLGPESVLVLLQYNPPFWKPAAQTHTPLLWLAGGGDILIRETAERHAARHYQAKYHLVPGEGHNLMMEKSYRETAAAVHEWLASQGVC